MKTGEGRYAVSNFNSNSETAKGKMYSQRRIRESSPQGNYFEVRQENGLKKLKKNP